MMLATCLVVVLFAMPLLIASIAIGLAIAFYAGREFLFCMFSLFFGCTLSYFWLVTLFQYLP
jgi:hypothetical protein